MTESLHQHLSVYRELKPVCSKCCQHHRIKDCTSKVTICPKCGGNHRFSDCSQEAECFHCKKAGKTNRKHCANSRNCPLRFIPKPLDAEMPQNPAWMRNLGQSEANQSAADAILEMIAASPLSNIELAGLIVKVIEKRMEFPPLR